MKSWPRCRIYSLDEFWSGIKERYDFVLCANVLSVIPSRRIRSRSLLAILACLTPTGTVFLVNQHTNSYFTEASASPYSVKYLELDHNLFKEAGYGSTVIEIFKGAGAGL